MLGRGALRRGRRRGRRRARRRTMMVMNAMNQQDQGDEGDYPPQEDYSKQDDYSAPEEEGPAFSDDDAEQLEKLADLKDKGIITEEEFNQKKKQILGL